MRICIMEMNIFLKLEWSHLQVWYRNETDVFDNVLLNYFQINGNQLVFVLPRRFRNTWIWGSLLVFKYTIIMILNMWNSD